MALFLPAVHPTRRKRRRAPWAAIAGICSALIATWMILQVNQIHQKRHEDGLRDMFAPSKAQRAKPAPPTKQPNSPPRDTEPAWRMANVGS